MHGEASRFIGDYEVLGVLGAGGMGCVYRVRNVVSDRIEAMKILLPDLAGRSDLADRFLREIKLVASFDHPNIATLYAARVIENQLIMVMEFVDGVTIGQLLEPGPIPLPHAMRYLDQVLSALGYAHGKGIIHRDIKPANIMVNASGAVKLMDFGIARVQTQESFTRTGTMLGSVEYMSPEQIMGGPTDIRSDLYSVGVSIYEMVTGQRPFKADSDFGLMDAHVRREPRLPTELQPWVPAPLSAIIMKAIAKDPRDRFQHAGELRTALRAVAPASNFDEHTIDSGPLLTLAEDRPWKRYDGIAIGYSAPPLTSVTGPTPVALTGPTSQLAEPEQTSSRWNIPFNSKTVLTAVSVLLLVLALTSIGARFLHPDLPVSMKDLALLLPVIVAFSRSHRKPPRSRNPFRLTLSFNAGLYGGLIGGSISGLLIGLPYYFQNRGYVHRINGHIADSIGWGIVPDSVLYSALIGLAVGAGTQYLICWFRYLVRENHFPVVLFNDISAGIAGGILAGIGVGAEGGWIFGARQIPAISDAVLICGSAAGPVFIVLGSLLYDYAGRWQSIARAVLCSTVVAYLATSFGVYMLQRYGIGGSWFNGADAKTAIKEGIVLGIVVGVMLGMQVGLSTLLYRLFEVQAGDSD